MEEKTPGWRRYEKWQWFAIAILFVIWFVEDQSRVNVQEQIRKEMYQWRAFQGEINQGFIKPNEYYDGFDFLYKEIKNVRPTTR